MWREAIPEKQSYARRESADEVESGATFGDLACAWESEEFRGSEKSNLDINHMPPFGVNWGLVGGAEYCRSLRFQVRGLVQ